LNRPYLGVKLAQACTRILLPHVVLTVAFARRW
jgi:hypothetical protein